MKEPDFLSSMRIAIVGLGLMGGSLAMALDGKCACLLGVDTDPETVSLARRLNIVEKMSSDLGEILPEADLIILATPVRTILTLLHDLPDIHPGTAMVMDLGSTKSQIMGAMQGLPERFDPFGGHPMCGKERLSLSNAEPGLFNGAPFAFSALPRTSARARLLAEQLAVAVGAQPLWLDPETHDRWTAATSHLPYLIANTLAGATPLEARPMVGSGLRSTTRLAGTPLHMMADILVTNRENILQSMKCYRENLQVLEDSLMASDFDALQALLEQGQANYEILTG